MEPASPSAPAELQPSVAPESKPTAPPPAAEVVIEGPATEQDLDLRAELDKERTARRKAETDAAYAQDEARRLKELQSQRPPRKEPPKRAPLTFFDDEED